MIALYCWLFPAGAEASKVTKGDVQSIAKAET